ncbi:hypothetical protein DPMN_043554 [Dreissena polymorpha]|uniref:Uncharacterized protein n=1 Tax=Dreissena polymorpha TaxID=45954 RepID=A0A9D4D0R1_DREPO|nr:hypothetical protein DPMN_043554 [Dreissena polymorpha]
MFSKIGDFQDICYKVDPCIANCHTFDMNAFPRYKYTAVRVESFNQRWKSLKHSEFFQYSFGNVRLELICDGLSRKCKQFTENAFAHIKAVESNIKHNDGTKMEPTVSVVHTHCFKNDAVRNLSELMLLTNGNQMVINNLTEEHKSKLIVVSKTEDLEKNTNLLLERYVCGVLGKMVDTWLIQQNDTNVLQDIEAPDPFQNHQRLSPKKTINNHTTDLLFDCDDQQTKENGFPLKKRKSSEDQGGSLRSGKRFRPSEGTSRDRESKLEILLLDVMALYERSEVPKSEWPQFLRPKTQYLNRKNVSALYKADPSIIACGYQHHILEIFLNRPENSALDSAIIKTLQGLRIVYFHLNYGPSTYRPLAGIDVGTKLSGKNGRFGTLGGFAFGGQDVYALISRHFADEQEDGFIYYRNANDYSECIAVRTRPAQDGRDELDIAAAKVLPTIQIKDTRFKTSTGALSNTLLFRFQGKTDKEVQRLLQGEMVFAWTANSSAGFPSLGRIIVPLCIRPNCRYKYVVIVNDATCDDDNIQAESQRGEMFGKPGDSGAIVCADDKDGKGVHVISMFMGELQGRDATQFMTLPLQQGLQQINRELGLNLEMR